MATQVVDYIEFCDFRLPRKYFLMVINYCVSRRIYLVYTRSFRRVVVPTNTIIN